MENEATPKPKLKLPPLGSKGFNTVGAMIEGTKYKNGFISFHNGKAYHCIPLENINPIIELTVVGYSEDYSYVKVRVLPIAITTWG